MDSAFQEILLFLPLIILLGIGYVSVLVGILSHSAKQCELEQTQYVSCEVPSPSYCLHCCTKVKYQHIP